MSSCECAMLSVSGFAAPGPLAPGPYTPPSSSDNRILMERGGCHPIGLDLMSFATTLNMSGMMWEWQSCTLTDSLVVMLERVRTSGQDGDTAQVPITQCHVSPYIATSGSEIVVYESLKDIRKQVKRNFIIKWCSVPWLGLARNQLNQWRERIQAKTESVDVPTYLPNIPIVHGRGWYS